MPNSNWTTSGTAISLVPVTTPLAPGSDPTNVNYLTNQDKIILMAQYVAELATKTSLDSTAASLSLNTTAYDNAVAAINATLTTAGAPSNWATAWPDGTVFGPVLGIQTLIASDWAAIAAQRSYLQASISAAQAANAKIAAVLVSQPHQVSWAYASKPTLPDAVNYPAGYFAVTTDARFVQVSPSGTTWQDVLYSANGIFGRITSGQIAANAITSGKIAAGAITGDMITAGRLTANVIYFSDGFCLNTLEPSEAGSNVTANHILTASSSPSGVFTVPAVLTWSPVTGLGFSVTAAGPFDVFNIYGLFDINNTGTNNAVVNVCIYVDGVQQSGTLRQFNTVSYDQVQLPYFASIVGLSAGSHTFQFEAHCTTGTTNYIEADSYVLCQRIF